MHVTKCNQVRDTVCSNMWSVLVGWGFVGIIVGLLISAAFGVLSMTPPQHTLAEVGFSITAVILLSRVGWWIAFEHPSGVSLAKMLVFSFFCFGCIGVLWYTAVQWIEGLRPAREKFAEGEVTFVWSDLKRDYPVLRAQLLKSDPLVSVQLLPPLYSNEKECPDDKVFWLAYNSQWNIEESLADIHRTTDVSAVLIAYHNTEPQAIQNVAFKLSTPPQSSKIANVQCAKPHRMYPIDGGPGASFVQLLAPQLVTNEHQECIVEFQTPMSNYIPADDWTKEGGILTASSEGGNVFRALRYRNQFCKEELAHPGSPRKYKRKVIMKIYYTGK